MPRRVHRFMQDANDPDDPLFRGTNDPKQNKMPRAPAVSCDVQRPISCTDFVASSGADDIRAGFQCLQCIPEELAVRDYLG